MPIPRCGHLCQEERPDVVNAELLEFLADWAQADVRREQAGLGEALAQTLSPPPLGRRDSGVLVDVVPHRLVGHL
ncbi:alpha/beta fold hydrolase [Streptomyces tubercidicus]